MASGTGTITGVGGPRVRIRIVEKDVEWGERDSSSRCMVARAIARDIPDATRIEVDTQTIRFTTHAGRFAYLTPPRVQQYVTAFDAGDPIEPFEFTLRNPLRIKQRLLSPEEVAENRHRRLTEAARSAPAGGPRPKAKTATTYTTDGDVGSPPRVFKTKARTYGHRVLRVNRAVAP